MKTLNLVITVSLLFTALSARADNTEIKTGEMLSALISSSASVQLVDSSGQAIDGEGLADMLGNTFAVDILAARKQKSTVLNSVSGKCVSTDVGKFGVVYYDCTLRIVDGDYKVTRSGYEGPELESSKTFTFKGTKSMREDGKFRLEGTTVTVQFAG